MMMRTTRVLSGLFLAMVAFGADGASQQSAAFTIAVRGKAGADALYRWGEASFRDVRLERRVEMHVHDVEGPACSMGVKRL